MQYSNILALRVSLETGMRIDDVLSLKVSDLKKRTITYIAKKTGKQDKKTITNTLSTAIRALADESKSEYIFPHRNDPEKHRTRQAVFEDLRKARERIGIKDHVTPHSARKSYAVHLRAEKGFEAVQKALQHDNASTTMIYAFADVLGNERTKPTQNTAEEINTLTDHDKLLIEAIASAVVERLKTTPPKATGGRRGG